MEDAGEELLLQVFSDHGQALLEVGAVVGDIREIGNRDVDRTVGRKCNHDGVRLVTDRGRLDVEEFAHQGHTLVLVLGQDMGIGIRREGHRSVTQDHGQGLGIHLLLHGPGGKGMPERMEGEVGQARQLQDLAVVVPEGPGLHVAAHGIRDDHAAVAIILSCGGPVVDLHRPPCLEILDHLGQQRHRPGRVFGLRSLNDDLRGVLAGGIGPVHLVQPAQGPADI